MTLTAMLASGFSGDLKFHRGFGRTITGNSAGRWFYKTTMNETECRELALKAATDYVTKKGIKSGLNGKQHAGILTAWAVESEGLAPMERWAGFLELGNASALRQRLEKNKVLAKDATAMAEDYI